MCRLQCSYFMQNCIRHGKCSSAIIKQHWIPVTAVPGQLPYLGQLPKHSSKCSQCALSRDITWNLFTAHSSISLGPL